MATITVRALSSSGEPQQGNGHANFLSDLDAVAQIILTRLKLFQGEWWLNLTDGLPLFQSILGAPASSRNLQVIANIISSRILGTPYVNSISSFDTTFVNRQLVYSAQVETAFGSVSVTNNPGSSATLTSS